MTTDLHKCRTCQVWKDTKGKGNKHCQRCNVWREILKPMDLPNLDTVPDEVIEQYPDLHEGKITTILQAIGKLAPNEFTVFCQYYIGKFTRHDFERYYAHPPYIGYSGKQIERIVKRALKNLQRIVKK